MERKFLFELNFIKTKVYKVITHIEIWMLVVIGLLNWAETQAEVYTPPPESPGSKNKRW